MKFLKELNVQKEMDCRTGAEISRHTHTRGRKEGIGDRGREGTQIAFCRLQTKAFLGGERGTGINENPSLERARSSGERAFYATETRKSRVG